MNPITANQDIARMCRSIFRRDRNSRRVGFHVDDALVREDFILSLQVIVQDLK